MMFLLMILQGSICGVRITFIEEISGQEMFLDNLLLNGARREKELHICRGICIFPLLLLVWLNNHMEECESKFHMFHFVGCFKLNLLGVSI